MQAVRPTRHVISLLGLNLPNHVKAHRRQLRGFMVVPPLDSDAAEVFGRVRTLTDDVARRRGRYRHRRKPE